MDMLVPIGGFVFVVAGLGALDSIKRGESWGREAFFSGLGFAVMVYFWLLFTAH